MSWKSLLGMTSVKIMIVGVGLLLVAVALMVYLWRRQRLRSAQGAWAALEKELLTYGERRQNTVLRSHISLPGGGPDFLLAGPFGLVFVQAVGEGPIVYGEARSPHWRVRREGCTEEFPNPLLALEGQMEECRGIFAKAGLFGVPMEPLVVFTAPGDLELVLGDTAHTVRLKELRRYLKDNKRLAADGQQDPARLLAILGEQSPKV